MGKRKKDMFGSVNQTDTAQEFSEIVYGDGDLTLDLKAQLADELNELEKEKIQPGELHVDKFVLYADKLSLEYKGNLDDLTFDEWQQMGAYLHQHQSAIQWMIGDWVLMAEEHLDEWISEDDALWQDIKARLKPGETLPDGKYKWLALQTDYSYSSLTKFKHYAEMFPVFRRRKTLTYSHHVEVAKLDDPAAQDRMLDAAQHPEDENKNRLSVRELRQLIEDTYSLPDGGNAGEDTEDIPFKSDIEKLRQFTGSKQYQNLSKEQQRALYNELQSVLKQMKKFVG